MQATREVWGKSFATSSREKLLDKHRELAEHEWARLKASDSLDCRSIDFMDSTRQSKRAAQLHPTVLANGEATSIGCHKGIAHKLPAMPDVPGW